ncbi:MAG: hypothetical protein LBR99_05800, partial [Treponema sp.]|nr:hypothetical protein [Treponema sp.]
SSFSSIRRIPQTGCRKSSLLKYPRSHFFFFKAKTPFPKTKVLGIPPNTENKMTWEVETTNEYDVWFLKQSADGQASIQLSVFAIKPFSGRTKNQRSKK